MSRNRTTLLLAKGLLALTILATCHSAIRAGCDGCATSSSHLHATLRRGCNACRYRPGNSPTLINSETFGFSPTVWSLWPGPLDPNTSYPVAAPVEPVKPPATPPEGKESPDKPAPPLKPPKSEKPTEKPTSPYAGLPPR